MEKVRFLSPKQPQVALKHIDTMFIQKKPQHSFIISAPATLLRVTASSGWPERPLSQIFVQPRLKSANTTYLDGAEAK